MRNTTFLLYLALGVVLLSSTLIFGFPESEKSAARKQTDDSVEVLSKEYLIGIWQDMPTMGSGWSNHYNFYESGKFKYFYSQMDCGKRVVEKRGRWELEEDQLTLTTTDEVVMTGGRMVPSSGSCGSPTTLVDAFEESRQLETPLVETVKVTIQPKSEEYIHPMIRFDSSEADEKFYWKFDDNPASTDNEFPEE